MRLAEGRNSVEGGIFFPREGNIRRGGPGIGDAECVLFWTPEPIKIGAVGATEPSPLFRGPEIYSAPAALAEETLSSSNQDLTRCSIGS